MRKAIVATILIFVLFAGCNIKPPEVTQPTLFPPMSKSEAATLAWTDMPDAAGVKGINIYVGKGDTSWIHEDGNSDILKQHLINDSPVTDTTYELTNLENGEEYFVQIRVVVGGSPTDEGTEIKRFYPRPEGQVSLYAIGEGENTGFYWNENGEITVTKAEDNPEIVDVCVIKDSTGKYFLVSPSEQFETGKITGFTKLGEETDGWEWYKIIDAPTDNYESRIELTPNIIVSVHTSSDNYAKLRFESSTSNNQINATAISLTWAFQTRKGYYHY